MFSIIQTVTLKKIQNQFVDSSHRCSTLLGLGIMLVGLTTNIRMRLSIPTIITNNELQHRLHCWGLSRKLLKNKEMCSSERFMSICGV